MFEFTRRTGWYPRGGKAPVVLVVISSSVADSRLGRHHCYCRRSERIFLYRREFWTSIGHVRFYARKCTKQWRHPAEVNPFCVFQQVKRPIDGPFKMAAILADFRRTQANPMYMIYFSGFFLRRKKWNFFFYFQNE